MSETIETAVERALEELRPYIAMHKGKIDFVSYQHPFVRVKLSGSCENCPISMITLKLGIQKKLRLEWPDIEVVAEEAD
ncbi:MAG: NifU family protein [Patescibacteria group bacterium]